LLLLIVAAYAAEGAELIGPAQADFGKLVQVKVSDDLPPEASVIWLVLEPRDFEYVIFGRTFVCSATSSITLIASINNPHEILFHTVVVGEQVKPDPDPKPDPEPPKPTSIFALIIEETADRDQLSPGQVQALLSKPVRDYMVSHNYGFRLLDKDVNGSLPQSLRTWIDYGKVKPLPYLIITDQEGAVIHEETLAPTTNETSLFQTLRRYGG